MKVLLTFQTHKNVSEGSSGLPRKHFLTLKKKELYFKYHELHPFKINRGFSDCPVVRTQSSNAGGLGLVPGGRTKSTWDVWGSKKKKKRKGKTNGSIVFSMFTKLCNYLCISNLYPLTLIPAPDNHWSTFFFYGFANSGCFIKTELNFQFSGLLLLSIVFSKFMCSIYQYFIYSYGLIIFLYMDIYYILFIH